MKLGCADKPCKRSASRYKPMLNTCNPLIHWMAMNRRKLMRCIRTRGKKSDPHLNPADPPRRRANKQRGHGTYANDRPPIVGTVGRDSGKVRLRVVKCTDKHT